MNNVKPISQMSFSELGDYAPSLQGWDWRLANGSRPMRGFGGRIIAESDARIIDENNEADHEHIEDLNLMHGDVYGVIVAYQGGYEDYDDEGVDVRDSATKGCIMAMIRERHGEGCYVKYDLECGWAVFDREGGLIAGHGGQSWSKDEIFTEEEYAMVAALAADETITHHEPRPDAEYASNEDIVATFEVSDPKDECAHLDLSDLRRKRIEFHKQVTKIKEVNFVDSTKEALMWQQATNLELAMAIEKICSILGIEVTYGEKG